MCFIILIKLVIMNMDRFAIDYNDIDRQGKKCVEDHYFDRMQRYDQDDPKYDVELATYIHDKFSSMTEQEMRQLIGKCLSITQIKHILLRYELKSYKSDPVEMSLDKFVHKAKKLISHYQCKAGGFKIEDIEWYIHRSNSTEYDVEEHEILFENTISKFHYYSPETQEYIDSLIKQLENIATNIEIEERYQEKNGIMFILLWARDINKKPYMLIDL